jgi:regulatory protein
MENMKLKRSALEPDYFEVWNGSEVIKEIFAPFLIRYIPASFETMEHIHKWLSETEWKLAKARAYRLLSMRSYSEKKMREKLFERRFSKEVCDRLIDELKRLSYLQDSELAKAMALRECKRGYGPRYISLKLRSKGLDPKGINEWISREMQREEIERLIKKFSDRKKAIQTLLRRGFDSDLVIEILR